MVTMVCGGFFLSFCFGRMANIVGRLDAEKSARSEQVSPVLTTMTSAALLPAPPPRACPSPARARAGSNKAFIGFPQMDQVTQFLKDVDLPKPLSRK